MILLGWRNSSAKTTKRLWQRWAQKQHGPTTEVGSHPAWHLVPKGGREVFVVGEISFEKPPCDTLLKGNHLCWVSRIRWKLQGNWNFLTVDLKTSKEGSPDLETKPTKNSDMFQADKTLGVLSITCICHYHSCLNLLISPSGNCVLKSLSFADK